MRISKYISLAEATKSQTAERLGIENMPDAATIQRMKYVAEKVFDPLREHFGVPIGVSSFYRSTALNAAIGGSKTSQHRSGEAIDIDADMFGGITNKQIFDYIRYNLDFDQLISEFGTRDNPNWVHVSLTTGYNRRQVLRAFRTSSGKTAYENYTP